ncbi:hypothetical protein [Citreimonas sp.]|uniref:hypothetical protein n=1 Tax=Citreimonas sp. TaxID=3036715 RepID=UPI0040585234
MPRLTLAAALLLAGTPLHAQDDGSENSPREQSLDDCAFLVRAFEGVVRQGMAGGGEDSVATLTQIQTNVLLMANGLECDMAPFVEVTREGLQEYGPDGAPAAE